MALLSPHSIELAVTRTVRAPSPLAVSMKFLDARDVDDPTVQNEVEVPFLRIRAHARKFFFAHPPCVLGRWDLDPRQSMEDGQVHQPVHVKRGRAGATRARAVEPAQIPEAVSRYPETETRCPAPWCAHWIVPLPSLCFPKLLLPPSPPLPPSGGRAVRRGVPRTSSLVNP